MALIIGIVVIWRQHSIELVEDGKRTVKNKVRRHGCDKFKHYSGDLELYWRFAFGNCLHRDLCAPQFTILSINRRANALSIERSASLRCISLFTAVTVASNHSRY